MEGRISATELSRRLGDILGRVRYRGESFVIERNGDQVARLVPLPGKATATLREAVAATALHLGFGVGVGPRTKPTFARYSV